jgi:ATP-dependent RNA helicase DDX54/DBP10
MSKKRIRHEASDTDDTSTDTSKEYHISGDAIDISSALTGKKRKLSQRTEELEDDDDKDFSRFVQQSIAKRNMKTGTQVVKSIKGNKKVVKGEVGGGSFQSMGGSFVQLLRRRSV